MELFHTANTKIHLMFIWYQYHLIPNPGRTVPELQKQLVNLTIFAEGSKLTKVHS